MDATPEEWRPIAGYEGFYEVSNLGRVRSLDRTVRYRDGRQTRHQGKILRPFKEPTYGYAEYHLRCPPQGRILARAHVLVLEAFVGSRPDGLVACHNDGDGSNNHLSNLRWDTYSSNNFDLVKHGVHWQTAKTHCKNGHEFTPENTIQRPEGGRKCRECQYKATALWTKKSRAARRPDVVS